jgi:hypothetical protein
VLVVGLALVVAGPALGSDAGYLYGTVETSQGKRYQGQLRWGDEEAFWDDIFNATKTGNENIEHLDRATRDRLRRRNWMPWDVFTVRDEDHFVHLLAVRFGDLKRIEVHGGDDVTVEFRNGVGMELSGGSNDVGAEITVVDPKQGEITLRWKNIRAIDFAETPARLENKLGEPIYGTVRSGRYEFTGRIQWDHDEALTTDELDGETRDGRTSIAFEDIASIRKYRNGAMVKLRSGSETYLRGTNDVNHENRGVVVIVPRLGSVKIGWEDFDEVTFRSAPNSGRGYAEYANAAPITGVIQTRDGRVEGRIAFDLDESQDFELLHGKNGDTEYLIAFRDIGSIRPKGLRRTEVELRGGLRIELEDGQDVTSRNDGLLVFTGARKPTYVEWRDVREIVLK